MTDAVLVVGASLAGLRAAEGLRAAGWAGPITVVGAEPHPPYNRPPLTKEALRGDAGLEPLLLPQRPPVADVEWLLGQSVVRVDLAGRRLRTSAGRELAFRGLVVATGLRPRRLPWARGCRRSHAVRTLDDARRLGAALRPARRVVVIGAGPVGCEVATRAVDAGARVVLVDPLPGPLFHAIGGLASAALAGALGSYGVRTRLGRRPVSFEEGTDGAAVHLDDGTGLPADVVVEAVGSTPNTEWLAGSGLDLTDGVGCDPLLRAGGRPDVVACGDVARAPVGPDGGWHRAEHWAAATATGRHAASTLAAHLLDRPAGLRPYTPRPSFWSDQAGLRVQARGRTGGSLTARLLDGHPDAPEDGITVGFDEGAGRVGLVALGRPQYTAHSLAAPRAA